MVFLRDQLKTANGAHSAPAAVQTGLDGAFSVAPQEQLFFDEEGPWRASQRNDELIAELVDGGFKNDVQSNGCDLHL